MHSSYLKPVLFISILLLSVTAHAQQLEKRKILSNTMEILLPADFKTLDAKMRAIKYPSNNKLAEAYTNEEVNINIGFNPTEQPLQEPNVYRMGKQLEQQLLGSDRAEKPLRTKELKVNGKNVYTIAFISPAKDTKVYNRMFLFSHKGKLVLGTFNCTVALQGEWEKKADEIILSLKEM